MEMIMGLLKSILETYSALLPHWLIAILLIIGTLRVVVKPALAFAYAVVAVTPSTADDAAVKKVEESKWMKSLLFVLDWFASLKLPAKK